MKRTLACLVAVASLGCTARALKGMRYTIGADYWTAGLDASMEPEAGGSVTHDDLGMSTEADVYDLRFSVANPKRGTRQAERWAIGFWQAKYAGATVPDLSGLVFGDASFTDAGPVSTDATFTAYRLAYEEATVSGNRGNVGWLGLAFFTFNVSSTQPATSEEYTFERKNIPALTVGYRFEEYRGKVSYYASGEWMDLGVFKLGGTTGEHLDTSVGIKWNVSQKVFVALGYKYYVGEYNFGGSTSRFSFQGLTVGGEIRF